MEKHFLLDLCATLGALLTCLQRGSAIGAGPAGTGFRFIVFGRLRNSGRCVLDTLLTAFRTEIAYRAGVSAAACERAVFRAHLSTIGTEPA